MNKIFKFFLLIFILLITTSCTKTNYVLAKQDYLGYLDTVGYVIVEYDANSYSDIEVKTVLKEIEDILLKVEKEFSIEQTIYMQVNNIEKSTLMEVNENSGIQPTKVSPTFLELLELSIEYAKLTNGAFDPSIGALTTLWDISGKAEYCQEENDLLENICTIPNEETIQSAKELVGYEYIQINKETNEVFLTKKGMKLDFGSVGKGYAAEQIREHLNKYPFSYSIINMGGNVVVNGKLQSEDENPKIDVASPFGNGHTGYYYPAENTGGVTSGTYERYITINGNKYHHILDPKTGYPANTEIVSVTIMGKDSCVSDALSTSVFMLGASDAVAFINNLEGYEAIIITNNKKVYLTDNMNFILEEKLEIIK